jgi:hypothetical protein
MQSFFIEEPGYRFAFFVRCSTHIPSTGDDKNRSARFFGIYKITFKPGPKIIINLGAGSLARPEPKVLGRSYTTFLVQN